MAVTWLKGSELMLQRCNIRM